MPRISTKKLEINIELLNSKIDRQIEVNNSSKNAISLIITILALGIPIAINLDNTLTICSFDINLAIPFLILAVIIIAYSLYTLPIELHTGVKLGLFYENKKNDSDSNYLLSLYNELLRSADLNQKVLHKKNSHYNRINNLTKIAVILFLIISLYSMSDDPKMQTGSSNDPDYYQETMIFKEFTTGNNQK